MRHEDAVRLILCALEADGGGCVSCAGDVFEKAYEVWPGTDWEAAIIEATERPVEDQYEDWGYERQCLLQDLARLKEEPPTREALH